ncbi:MAG: hypothetical protein J7K33_07690 [Candidatus Marinimicrobia bacterium]|nr:hypothetical protein [Candidatus Neomarinimicrobiota bacterium]
MTKEEIKAEIKWLLESKCKGVRFKCILSFINIFDVSNLWTHYSELLGTDVDKWIKCFQGPYLYMKFRGLLPLCSKCLFSDMINLVMDDSYTQAQFAEIVGNFPLSSLFLMEPFISFLFSIWQSVYASGYRQYYDNLPEEVMNKIIPWAKKIVNGVMVKENIEIPILKKAIEETVLELMYEENEMF